MAGIHVGRRHQGELLDTGFTGECHRGGDELTTDASRARTWINEHVGDLAHSATRAIIRPGAARCSTFQRQAIEAPEVTPCPSDDEILRQWRTGERPGSYRTGQSQTVVADHGANVKCGVTGPEQYPEQSTVSLTRHQRETSGRMDPRPIVGAHEARTESREELHVENHAMELRGLDDVSIAQWLDLQHPSDATSTGPEDR